MAHVAAHAAIIAQAIKAPGAILYTKAGQPMALSGRSEVIAARSIWVPQ